MIYPRFDREEAEARDEGVVGRNPKDIISKLGEKRRKIRFMN